MSESSTGIDETYYPPFPWCTVNIYDLSRTKKVIVRGYIDTGSDGTIVTIDVSKKLGRHKWFRREEIDYD